MKQKNFSFCKIAIVMSLLVSGALLNLKAQVAVGGDSKPNATLEVVASAPSNAAVPEGIIAPRLTGDQIKTKDNAYGTAQQGAIVYATSAVTTTSTKTANITVEGYYYFDGSVWKRFVGYGSSILPPDFCVDPCDCDGDGLLAQGGSCGGNDHDDNNSCVPAVAGISASISPGTVTVGGSATITLTASTGSINNLSVDGGLTLIKGNSITVSPTATTTYILRVNNCATQVLTVTVPVQPVGTIGTLTCGSNSMTATAGTAISSGNTFNIAYSNKTGGNIVLTNNQDLGIVVNGMKIQANGDQTLTSASGSINIKVTGTPVSAETTILSYSIGGRTCTVSVTSSAACVPIASVSIGGGNTVKVTSGNTLTLSVESISPSSMTSPSYQWYYNGIAISGATGSTYSRPSMTINNAGNYAVDVTNNCTGVVRSNTVKVVVTVSREVCVQHCGTLPTMDQLNSMVSAGRLSSEIATGNHFAWVSDRPVHGYWITNDGKSVDSFWGSLNYRDLLVSLTACVCPNH